MKKIKIIATIGPSSFLQNKIKKMDSSGVNEFRINVSHTLYKDYKETINKLTSWTSKPIYTDTEGAQLRTGKLDTGTLEISLNSIIKFTFKLNNNHNAIPLYPYLDSNIFVIGDLLFIDFNSVVVQITEVKDDLIYARVISGGTIGSNKGIGTDRIIQLPYITQKDQDIIKLAIQLQQKHFCLSFASSGEDVQKFRKLFPYEIKVTSKIENRLGINNLKEICKYSDEILVDRGDLSREIALPTITMIQKEIIKAANQLNTPVNIATNLLESMVTENDPTRAEISDITNALIDEVSGLVLAAETAIGNNPVNSVRMVKRIIDNFSNYSLNNADSKYNFQDNDLVRPHGGELVNQYIDESNIPLNIPTISISQNLITDCYQIGSGTYSPLKGFMCLEELNSVLKNNLLLDGTSWPLPIILQVDKSDCLKLNNLKMIAIKDEYSNKVLAIIEDVKVEKLKNIPKIANDWFMTTDISHPGVKRLFNSGENIISGKVSVINKPFTYVKPFELTPRQARRIFIGNYWENIIGFHTRNIPHKGHEYIQKMALEQTNADALFISPVLGNSKPGDFKSEAIIAAYKELVNNNSYAPYGALLGGINTYSRFSGHREAVFTAICRQNFGCTHFIVGRDHAGINGYYKNINVEEYFNNFPELNIQILFFDEVVYYEEKKEYLQRSPLVSLESKEKKISGTLCREYLIKRTPPPEYLVSSEVAKAILKLPSFINE